MSKRLVLSVSVLSLLAACADTRSGVGPARGGSLNAISEARFGGNADFFFAAPLATTPQAGDANFDVGGANQAIVPYARVCETDGVNTVAGCVTDVTLEVTGSATGIALAPAPDGEFYLGSLPTEALNPHRSYRIEVWGIAVSSPAGRAEVDPRWLFGWRDVHLSPTPASCTGAEADCPITYGVPLPLKVRVEQFAFCPDTRSCATQVVVPGQDAVLDAQLPPGSDAPNAQLFIPAQEGTSFVISFEPCTAAEDAAVAGALDIPTFGPCLKTETSFTGLLGTPAIVSLCDELDESGFGLSDDQRAQLALHHLSSDLAEATALPEAWQCTQPTAGGRPAKNDMRRYASAFRSRLAAWLSPRTLHAATPAPIDRGGGGLTLQLNSFFKLALPAKFEYVSASDASQTFLPGASVLLSAKVTDVRGAPVRNARVRWSVFSSPAPGGAVSSATPVLTDANGIASATVVLSTTAGMNVVHASGRGIAADGATECTAPSGSTASCNGPRPTLDPFLPYHVPEIDEAGTELPVDIAEGTRLPFAIRGCDPGFGTATVDGSFGGTEWACARSYSFTANVSGGSTPATLYVMNDGGTMYLALRIQRSATDRLNRLQFNFDNDNDGASEAGDDVLSLDAITGLTDAFLTLKCSNSSQSSCWAADVSAGGTNDGSGAAMNDGSWTTYEISHPLTSADNANDFSLSAGQVVGLFLSLQTGNGAAGNTQWPGFRSYLQVTIVP